MVVDTFAFPGAIPVDYSMAGRCCVVLDVLRATTCMTTALEHGAQRILPVAEVEEALALRAAAEEPVLLCGERGAVRISGFDAGNSPLEFTEEAVRGRTLVMTTTNGTRAILAASGAARILIGCMRNAQATAQRALEAGLPVTLLCAGTAGRYSMEDVLAAGAILAAMGAEADDLGQTARILWEQHKTDPIPLLRHTRHTQRLIALGMEDDVRFCMEPSVTDTVPEYRDGAVKLPGNP